MISQNTTIYAVGKCPKTGRYGIFTAETTFVGDHIVMFRPDTDAAQAAFRRQTSIGRSQASFSPAEAVKNFIFWADLEISRARELEQAIPEVESLC